MMEIVWDGAPLTLTERDHLSFCAECREQYSVLSKMRDEFEIARLSQVSSTAEQRLFAIFDQATGMRDVQSPTRKLWGVLAGLVKAIPLLDTRQQLAPVGIRSANQSTYRIVFGADEAEIELMVEPANGLLHMMGEVMVADSGEANGLSLIELTALADDKTALETESDAAGRFAFAQVPPGTYSMTITPRHSQAVVIEALELT